MPVNLQNDREKFKIEFKKRLYEFVLKIIKELDSLDHSIVSKRIGDQLLRSTTSIIGNYIEAQASSSKKDFTNYFHISLKSANESKLWISLLKDCGKLKPEVASEFLDELNQIAKILASSILTLKGRK